MARREWTVGKQKGVTTAWLSRGPGSGIVRHGYLDARETVGGDGAYSRA